MRAGLLWCALAFYGLGMGLSLPSVIRGRPALRSSALAALAAALLLNGSTLILSAIQLHRLPVVDVRSALSFFAFSITLAFFLTYRRYQTTWLGALILPFVFLIMLAAVLNRVHVFVPSALRGDLLIIHTSAMIVGYTGLFLTFVAAILYLLQAGELKSRHPRAFYYRLPALEICDRLYDRSLVFGLAFLSAGILAGCIWASRAWNGAWELDPKILASVLTWFIYLIVFATRVSGSWRGRRSAYAAILGFAAVMVTFLGASFLSSQHGYFPTITRMH